MNQDGGTEGKVGRGRGKFKEGMSERVGREEVRRGEDICSVNEKMNLWRKVARQANGGEKANQRLKGRTRWAGWVSRGGRFGLQA